VKDLLTLNDELVISVVPARCHTLVDKYGQSRQRWRIRFDPARFNPDLTVAIRLQGGFTNGPPSLQLNVDTSQ